MVSLNFQFSSLEIADDDNILVAREILTPSGPIGQLISAVAALAFLAGGVFFAFLPTGQPISETWWIRLLLGGGLATIGLIIAWSAFNPSGMVGQIEFDLHKRVVRYGTFSDADGFISKGTLAFSAIQRFYAGSQADTSVQNCGTTIFYVEADGGPRNGVLIVGSTFELEALARKANDMLKHSDNSGSATLNGQPTRQSGFGRRGI